MARKFCVRNQRSMFVVLLGYFKAKSIVFRLGYHSVKADLQHAALSYCLDKHFNGRKWPGFCTEYTKYHISVLTKERQHFSISHSVPLGNNPNALYMLFLICVRIQRPTIGQHISHGFCIEAIFQASTMEIVSHFGIGRRHQELHMRCRHHVKG